MKKTILITLVMVSFLGCFRDVGERFILISNENIDYQTKTIDLDLRNDRRSFNKKIYENNNFVVYKAEDYMKINIEQLELEKVYSILGSPNQKFSITFENFDTEYEAFSSKTNKRVTINYYHYINNPTWVKGVLLRECARTLQVKNISPWKEEGIIRMVESKIYEGKIIGKEIERYNSFQSEISLLYFEWSDLNSYRANCALSYFFFKYIEYKNIDIDTLNDKEFGNLMTEFRVSLIKKELPVFKNLNVKIFEGNKVNLQGGESVLIRYNKDIYLPEIDGIKYIDVSL